MKDLMTFFGIDIETSARDLLTGGRLIQIGAATVPAKREDPDTWSSLVFPGELTWEDAAYAVHGIDQRDVARAPHADEIDAALSTWLVEHGADPEAPADTIAIGFNVGTYDLPFIAVTLPKTFALLSYRAVDLNSVLFAMDGLTYDHEKLTAAGWKAIAKSYAARRLHATGQAAHDAGYDAAEAVLIWQFLTAALRDEPLDLPEPAVTEPAAQTQARAVTAALTADAIRAGGLDPQLVATWARGGNATDPARLARLEALYQALPADVRAAHPARTL